MPNQDKKSSNSNQENGGPEGGDGHSGKHKSAGNWDPSQVERRTRTRQMNCDWGDEEQDYSTNR